jgi:hypothetical protein
VSSSDGAEGQGISTHSIPKAEIYLLPLNEDVFSLVGFYIEVLLPDALPLLIVSVRPSQIPEMRPFIAGHEYAVRCRHRLTIDDLMNPKLEFSADHYQDPHMFIASGILTTFDVSACQILCYDLSIVTIIAALQPRLLVAFCRKRSSFELGQQSRLNLGLLSIFNSSLPSPPARTQMTSRSGNSHHELCVPFLFPI